MYNPQLDTFIAVADSGSFSKAAEKLFISPTAVIKQINLLESDLGFLLFVRTHRGIELTESGKSFYNDVKYFIQYAKESIVRAKNAGNKIDNVIKIGTSLMTPSQFILEIWPSVQQYCPNLKFKLVPFENTPENAREILRNLGNNIDIVSGVFDDDFLEDRKCTALELYREPICVAVSIQHPLANKDKLEITDLYGENLMLIHRGWNSYIDLVRDDLWENHPEINLKDFSFYDVEIFNHCEASNDLLMVIGNWENVHPLLKVIPISWNHSIPFGILYSPEPSAQVKKFIDSIKQVYHMNEEIIT